jgi:hypothetical protein
MAITDVIANIDALNGRTVRVAGYMGDCGRYWCVLARNADEYAQINQWHREMLAHRPGQRYPTIGAVPALGLGSGEDFAFDRQATPYVNSYVVITGRVSNRCRFHGRPICMDRNPDVLPTRIKHGSPPPPNRGNRS